MAENRGVRVRNHDRPPLIKHIIITDNRHSYQGIVEKGLSSQTGKKYDLFMDGVAKEVRLIFCLLIRLTVNVKFTKRPRVFDAFSVIRV